MAKPTHEDHQVEGSATMWPPGTICLDDMRPSDDRQVILQPRPSEDPNDPLNWSKWRKYWNFGLVCFYVAMVAEFINANSPTWGAMNKELGYSYEILNDSYAVGCASLGLGSIILIPFALKYGRRPIYIFSTVLQFALSIWSAKMQTVADIMLINILQCFFGSLAETIVQMTIADLFFVHQRGKMNAFYIWTWYVATYLGILIAGFVAKGQGWRWIWWWNVIFFGITIFVVFFGYEETKYIPPFPTSLPQSTEPHDTALPNADGEKVDVKTSDQGVAKLHRSIREAEQDSPVNLHTVHINPDIPVKTYWQRLAILTTTSSSEGGAQSFLRHTWQPLVLLGTIPAVAFAALVYGILTGLGDTMSATLSTYLPEPPYNFNSDQIGLMSIPRMIGSTIGPLVGPLSDWWIVYLARRNKGIYQPETRLWCIIPFLVFVPAGSLMFGIGLNNSVPWPVIAVGLALYQVGITSINTIVLTYLTDCYQDIIGDALVGVTVVRNTFSTAFVFAVTPWAAKVGIKWVMVTILVIACVILLFFIVFIKWGNMFRARFASRYHYYAARQYKERNH
ncbi:unnamed protein product [Clonostachys solani]|uniref:Uncharacterized protein n=1 Tax=Clonostachys solani TaxID=160281 RepID=A0A9N9ZGR3_9HYPO|nr:unnamed protein product [Clonostachys solani]